MSLTLDQLVSLARTTPTPEELAAISRSSEIMAWLSSRAAKCDHLEARNKHLQSENDSLREKHGEMRRDFRAVSDALRERTAERDAARGATLACPAIERDRLTAERDAWRDEFVKAENRANGLSRENVRLTGELGEAKADLERAKRDHRDAVELVDKLVHENRSLRGPVPPIESGEVDPLKEIIDLAWTLHDSMRAKGYRDWRVAGVCDSLQVDRLTAELAEARAAYQRLHKHIEEEHVDGWRRIQAILPEKSLEKASSLVEDVIDCIQELRAENGRQAAKIAALQDAGKTSTQERHDAIFWNPGNLVVQDHRDGTVIQPDTDRERAKRGLPPFAVEPPPLRLEVGRTYVRRDGGRETIVADQGESSIWRYVSDAFNTYTDDGTYGFMEGVESPADLVALAPTVGPASSHP